VETTQGLLKLGHLPKNYPNRRAPGGKLKLLLAPYRETLLPRAFFPLGFTDLSFQSLGAWQEMTDSGADEQAWVQ